MAITFQDYINVLKSGTYKPIAKIEWLRTDETVESTLISDILGGSLTINRNNGTRRSCNIELRGTPDLLPNVYTIWIKKKFKLWLGFNINGEDYFLPQGIFVLDNPSYNSSPEGMSITLSGQDKFSLLNGTFGGILKDIYQINAGTNVNNAVRTILTAFGDPVAPLMDITSITFPYDVRKNQDENIGDMLQEIAYFSSRNIFYDEEGRLNFLEDIQDDYKSSEWDFNTFDDKFSYLSGDYENLFSEVKNVVKIIGTNVGGTIPQYEAKNENPVTETEVSRIGELVYIELNDYISTVSQAQNLANYILKRKSVLGISGSLNSTGMFHLDVDKVITVTDSNMTYNKKRFLIDNINIGLGVGDSMTIGLIVSLDEDYFIGVVGS
jgi:hypothetical protein